MNLCCTGPVTCPCTHSLAFPSELNGHLPILAGIVAWFMAYGIGANGGLTMTALHGRNLRYTAVHIRGLDMETRLARSWAVLSAYAAAQCATAALVWAIQQCPRLQYVVTVINRQLECVRADVANAFATSVGSRTLKLKSAIVIAVVSTCICAEGHRCAYGSGAVSRAHLHSIGGPL